MSGGNDVFINIIENLGKEFQKLLTFVETLRKDKQGIETHINALKNCSNTEQVVNEVLEIKSNWEIICEVTETVCKIVDKLQSSLCTEKEVTVKNAFSPELNSEKISETTIDCIDQIEKTERDSERKTNQSNENNMSRFEENGTPSDIVVETKDIEENANISDDIDDKKKGVIRLVPLQKLLSTSGHLVCEVTISDSECDSDKGNQDQIFELSDSESEPLKNDWENEKSKEKPRNTCSEKDEHKSAPNISNIDIDVKRSLSELNESKSNEVNIKGHIDSSSNIDITSNNAIKGPNKDSAKNSEVKALNESSSSLSIGDNAKTNKNIHQNVLKEINNSFQKRCMVRVKRTSLFTANNNKLDQVKKNIKSSGKSAKNSIEIEKHSKKMNSDSESDIENPEQHNSSDGNSTSESEIVIMRKKRIFQEKAQASSESSSSEQNTKNKRGLVVRKKRKIISKSNSTSGDGSNDNGSDDDDDKNRKRKKIRKLINEKNLHDGTKKASKEEEERKKRIEERQKMYNQIYKKPENVEVDELILDFDESTKNPLLKVDDGLLKKLKPHQVNGIKFMWDACFETIKDCQEKPGSGCILAHCMGLGKTMQIVTLAHTLLTNMDVTQVERVLIISPLSTLNNWAREFHHWMNFAKKKDVEVYDMSKFKDKNTRVFKLNEWFTEGGVCIVGYDMYRILSNEKTKGLRKKQKESLQKSLVDPGPDVVVCDEGHLLKNEKTSLSQAVTKMRTKRRIVLTGTPLQNNLKEYYCMIQFIKPNLLGTYKEYLNRFVNPISNGQYTDSTERDIRLMKHRSHILHKMLEACIQRRDYSVLAPYLPPKHEYVVFLTLSDVQKQLYEYYMTTQRELIGEASGNPGKGAKLFQDFQDLRRIWTHPLNLKMNSDTVIRKKLARYDSDESIKDFIDDNSDESSVADSDSSSSIEHTEVCKTGTRITRATRDASENETDVPEITARDDPSEWWVKFVNETELNNINHSPKIVLLMTLLQRCEEIGDKVLVFSQSLQSLDVIEHFLSMIDSKTRGIEIDGDVGNFKGYWVPGVNYFRLDGSRTVENRESMCKSFNNISNLSARLFLISTRAGGLGINLVAANRVVIFDVSWNPSHDTQSIFRVYRFGQTKPCYIYRLIGLGTMEQKVYERQVAKQATAKRVIDEQQISRHYNQSDLQELYTYELESTTPREIPILPKDRLFAELLSNYEKLIFKYHEHDSLLENEDSENLTEEERKAAWDEYEAEKTRPAQLAMQYMPYDRQSFLSHYGTPSGSVTSNKIFGFRSDILLRLLNMKGTQDHPELTSAQVVQLVPEYLQRLYFEMNNGDPTLYKELLELHKTLEAPGGMYMNPLLFANQTSAPTAISPFGAQIGHYGQVHPGTSNLNSNEVYEVD